MKIHRFIGNFNFDEENITLRDSEILNQWKNVLRLKIGDNLVICDGNGTEAMVTITDLNKKEAIVHVLEITHPSREPRKKSTIFCALLKRENFELVVQKATEIGITNIVPILTTRTVKTGLNKERIEKIIKEASEQSGRTVLPRLSDIVSFKEAVETTNHKDTILFDLSEISTKNYNLKNISAFFIGPEGGFTEEEVSFAKEKGIVIASLGELTFRAETAAIVASYLVVQ